MLRRNAFAIGEYYHIFNRGVEKRKIFNQERDYVRFIDSLIFFNTEKSSWVINDLREKGIDARPKSGEMLVDIIAYCLNPNHFHLLLKENKENGVTSFMKKISTGYAMYFNKKYERSGVLFQGRFKSVHIGSNSHLLYASVYVNCNSQIHGIENAEKYPWCSLSEYLGKIGNICRNNSIIDQFKDQEEYRIFCEENITVMKDRKEMEKIILE